LGINYNGQKGKKEEATTGTPNKAAQTTAGDGTGVAQGRL